MTFQDTSIASSEQKTFLANYLFMLRACENFSRKNDDRVLKHYVEGACRIWMRMTGEKIDPVWSQTPGEKSCAGSDFEKIARKEQSDGLHMFWLLASACESEADNEKDKELQSKVEQWYEQWNRITGSEHEPRWVEREKQKDEIT